MVSQKMDVRVSQSCFLNDSDHLPVSIFCKATLGSEKLGLVIQKESLSLTKKKTLVLPSHIYCIIHYPYYLISKWLLSSDKAQSKV